MISLRALEGYVYKQVEVIICSLFLWEDGDFLYFDAQINLGWMVVVKLNTLQRVMDASRRYDETPSHSKGNLS